MLDASHTEQINVDVFKTKLTDGRYFTITPKANLIKNEYIISVISDPVFTNRLPVLLRQRILDIHLFSIRDNVYLKTEINPEDTIKIRALISSTPLNCFNLLFGQYEEL